MAGAIRLEHVGICARGEQFDQTVSFYERVLGWKRVREHPGPPTRLAFVSDGQGGMLEILDTEGSIQSNAHLAFMVPLEQFDETRDRLAELGVAFDPTSTTAAGDKLGYFNDPAGNRAQLVGRKTPLE
jgi:catechol 2,3-dioxygenase-like lactoylglutathione lyase family enzyme